MSWLLPRLDAPPMLWLLVLLPLLVLLYLHAFRRRRRIMAGLVTSRLAARLLPSTSDRRRLGSAACILGAVVCLVLALAQPRWGTSEEDLRARGRDIVVLLDISLSMLAQDVAPDRLTRAKRAVRSLAEAATGDANHRLALVTFAGRADLRCPPTRDKALFLDRLETVGVDDVSQRGSAIEGALVQAVRLVETFDPAFVDLVVISDGEDHWGQPLEAVRLATARGLGVFVVGVGDASRTVPVPSGLLDGGRSTLVHDGAPAQTRFRRGTLVGMAEAAGTSYVPLETGDPSLQEFYGRQLASRPRHSHGDRAEQSQQHRFQLFLGLAVLLLLLEAAVRRQAPPAPAPMAVVLRSSLLAAILAYFPVLGQRDAVQDEVGEGNDRFAAGDFATAREHYAAAARSRPGDPEIAYNLGDALVRAAEPDQAIEQFMTALAAESPKLRARAKYNIGVTRLEQALAPDRPPSEATWQYQASIRYFRESLALDPDLEDARYNLELAQRRLNELERSLASQRREETRLDDKVTLRRGAAQQDLLQEQEAGGSQKTLPDELRQTRADRSNDMPSDFNNKESPKGKNDTALPMGMSPDAAAEMMERLMEAVAKAEGWRHEQRVGRLPAAGEREPW